MSPTIFEDKAPNVAAAIIILVAISAVVFPLRIYTRIKHKAFGWDDFTMCCAAVSSTLLISCSRCCRSDQDGGSFLCTSY